jgi:hypothetical protein
MSPRLWSNDRFKYFFEFIPAFHMLARAHDNNFLVATVSVPTVSPVNPSITLRRANTDDPTIPKTPTQTKDRGRF